VIATDNLQFSFCNFQFSMQFPTSKRSAFPGFTAPLRRVPQS
jgi:hypothetical protein